MRFVDTNILLYAVSKPTPEREDERHKRSIALQILDRTDLALSVQVLQEFYVQATRPSRDDRLSHEQAADLIHAWLRYPIQENTVELLQAALATSHLVADLPLGRRDRRGGAQPLMPRSVVRGSAERHGLRRSPNRQPVRGVMGRCRCGACRNLVDPHLRSMKVESGRVTMRGSSTDAASSWVISRPKAALLTDFSTNERMPSVSRTGSTRR